MPRFLHLLFSAAASFGLTLVAAAAEDSPGRYFLVIDHSGSMLLKVGSGPDAGRSRWEVMRERAAGFADRLPDGSTVWAGVFSARDPSLSEAPDDPYAGWLNPLTAKFDTPAERQDFIARLKAFREPDPANGTWLYQATMEALLKAQSAGQNDPDAYLTVMVYTDGIDQGHGRTTAEMIKNKGSPCSKGEVDKKIRELRLSHRNFNIVQVYRPGDESILDAHVVRLLTNRAQLPSPLAESEIALDIDLRFKDDERYRLKGLPMGISWSTEGAIAVPPLDIVGGPFLMKSGETRVLLRRNGNWPQGRDVRARLKLDYPALQNTFLVEEGGSSIDLFFQGAEAPAIRDLLPGDGSQFPLGREVRFSLTTLPGCDIDWDFGDGSTGKGNPVTHAFKEPGDKTIHVKVTDPRTRLSASASTRVTANELKVSLDPFPVQVLPGQETLLTASAKGSFREFQWEVGGRTYVGRPRSDGIPGTELKLEFDRPGSVPVRVSGVGSAGGRAETDVLTIVVKEVPALRVTSPAPGEVLYFGSRRELRAEVEGVDANQLRFSLTVGDSPVVESTTIDVRREGPLRSAVLPCEIPSLAERVAALLVVETVDTKPILRREVEVRLESEPAFIQIVVPEGREPHIYRETPVRLDANAKVTEVNWDFGDGSGPVQGLVARHVWERYGKFTISASAKGPDGSRLEAIPVEVEVPVRPASARGFVIYKGRKVGAEVAKVPVNATLELRAETEGDTTGATWFLDDTALPDGQETVTVKSRGFHTLKLVVDATPEAGGEAAAASLVDFRTSDRILFWTLIAGILTVFGLASRLLLGNKWRFAQLQVGKRAEGSSADGGTIAMPWGLRSWWTKTSEIPMNRLDAKTCKQWSPDVRVAFVAGKDLRMRPLGAGWNKRGLDTELSKNLASGQIKRWKFQRLPLSRVKEDHEHRIGTITLVMPPLKPGIIGRWPEFALFLLVVATVATLRILYQWLY